LFRYGHRGLGPGSVQSHWIGLNKGAVNTDEISPCTSLIIGQQGHCQHDSIIENTVNVVITTDVNIIENTAQTSDNLLVMKTCRRDSQKSIRSEYQVILLVMHHPSIDSIGQQFSIELHPQ